MAMLEEAQAIGSISERTVVALENRMRVRRPLEKRARIKHGQITMPQAENAKEAWLFSIRSGAPLVSTCTWWPMSPTISASGSPRPSTAWSRASPPASALRRFIFARSARSGGSDTPT